LSTFRGTPYAVVSQAKGWSLMEHPYPHIVVLLFVGILLTFSAGIANEGLSRLGFVLIVASAVGLLIQVMEQRRDTRR
jgi:hypothetical protein